MAERWFWASTSAKSKSKAIKTRDGTCYGSRLMRELDGTAGIAPSSSRSEIEDVLKVSGGIPDGYGGFRDPLNFGQSHFDPVAGQSRPLRHPMERESHVCGTRLQAYNQEPRQPHSR